MPTLQDMFPSRFVEPEEVGKGVLVTITGIEQRDISGDASAVFKWLLRTKELDKPVMLPFSLAKNIEDVLNSNDSEDWIFRKLVLYHDPYVFHGGRMSGAIRARKPEPAEIAAQRHELKSKKRKH